MVATSGPLVPSLLNLHLQVELVSVLLDLKFL